MPEAVKVGVAVKVFEEVSVNVGVLEEIVSVIVKVATGVPV